jgi:hypothetical protein
MSQPVTVRQLSDAERVAILDKRVADLTINKFHGNTLESRGPFTAVIVFKPKPIKKSDWVWLVIITMFTFGLGLILCALFLWIKHTKPTRVRLDVTPTGNITKTKLPPSGS